MAKPLIAIVLYLRWQGGATSDSENAIPLMVRWQDLASKGWSTSQCKSDISLMARVVDLFCRGCKTSHRESIQSHYKFHSAL